MQYVDMAFAAVLWAVALVLFALGMIALVELWKVLFDDDNKSKKEKK